MVGARATSSAFGNLFSADFSIFLATFLLLLFGDFDAPLLENGFSWTHVLQSVGVCISDAPILASDAPKRDFTMRTTSLGKYERGCYNTYRLRLLA